MFVTNAFFLAAWDPQTPLRSAIASGLINLGLDLFLVNVIEALIPGFVPIWMRVEMIGVAVLMGLVILLVVRERV